MPSPLDDHPVHQIAEPIRHVATSDREIGYGLFAYLVLGAHARHGFEDFLDGAP